MQKKLLSLFVVLIFITTALCACQLTEQHSNQDLSSSSQTENTQDLPEEKSELTTAPNASNSTNEEKLPWQTAYLEFIETRESEYGKESAYGFNFRYALVYVDNDNIPELYASGACEADGDLIFSYKNGHLIEQHLARMFGGKYVERSGIIINQNGHMGMYYDIVYKLDENGFSQILNASYTERYVSLENDEFEIVNEYFINGKTVSKDEYNAAINATVDLSQAVEFYENSVSYDVIKQQIADCK